MHCNADTFCRQQKRPTSTHACKHGVWMKLPQTPPPFITELLNALSALLHFTHDQKKGDHITFYC